MEHVGEITGSFECLLMRVACWTLDGTDMCEKKLVWGWGDDGAR